MDVRGRVISDESIADEIPFDIPESWAWARFSELVPIQYGFPADSQQFNPRGKIGLIRIRDVNSGDLVHTVTRYDGDYDDRYVVHQGDDLIGMDGEFVCKRWQGEDALLNQRVCRLRYLGNTVSHDFIAYAIDWYLSEIWKVTSKTTVKHLSAKAMDELLFAVPPLAEQERIAAKTLEISPLVDEYGAFEDAREVLDSALPGELRQSVLQEAVEGRLVSQNPNDEPASVLLERIRQERHDLITQGKLKFPKGGESIIYTRSDGARYEKRVNQRGRVVSDECIEDEIPFDIPESWAWVRLGCFVDMQAGKNIAAVNISAKPTETQSIPCYGGNGVRGYVATPNRMHDHQIIGRQGALCGCINYAEGPFYATEHAVVVTSFGGVGNIWLGYILKALNLNQYATATAQPGLAVSKISEVLVPIPPLAEQKRIADKVQQALRAMA